MPLHVPMTHRATALLATVTTLGQIDKYMKSNDSMSSIVGLYRNSSLARAASNFPYQRAQGSREDLTRRHVPVPRA